MTYRVSRRRRLAEAVTFALASMSCGALVAAPAQQAKPLSSSTPASAPLLCAGPVLEKSTAPTGYALRYGFAGWEMTPVDAKSAEACVLKATAANLNLLFPENGNNAVLLEIAPQFVIPAGAGVPVRRFVASSTEPVLCESFYGSGQPDLLALTITDPNGRVQTVRGVQSLAYRPPVSGDATSARFSPVSASATFGPQVQCYAVPYATLPQGAPDVPAPGMALSTSIFGSGFEIVGPPAQRADLRIEILDGADAFLRRNLQATINTPFTYSIRVRNAGPVAANGVRLKEFVVDTGAPNPLLSPKVAAQGWTCTARGTGVPQSDPGTDCGTGTGVLAIGDPGFTLAAGASRTYTLTRNFPTTFGGQPNANDGDRSVLAAAVFFNPADATGQGDVSMAENLASAVFALDENPGPTITCSANAGNAAPHNTGTIQSPISLNEDAPPLSYSCALVDPDGVASFVASSSNNGLIAQGGLLGTRAGDTWPLTIAVPADLSGSAVLTFTAADTLGATRQLAVTVNVAEVNDPPSFDITGVDTTVPADGVIDRRIARIGLRGSGSVPYLVDQNGALIDLTALPPGTISVVRDANCGGVGSACSIRIVDFFRFVDAGPAPEVNAGQQVTVGTTACSQGGPENFFFTDARSSQLLPTPYSLNGATRPSGSNYDLVFTYDKSNLGGLNTNCNFRFRDTATSPATSIDTPSREVLFEGFAGS